MSSNQVGCRTADSRNAAKLATAPASPNSEPRSFAHIRDPEALAVGHAGPQTGRLHHGSARAARGNELRAPEPQMPVVDGPARAHPDKGFSASREPIHSRSQPPATRLPATNIIALGA